MQGLAFYEQVCRAYREGRGEPPPVLFRRAAQRVLSGVAIRRALVEMQEEYEPALPYGGPDP